MRKAGVLLPISSLPAKFGIGDLGPEAYSFVDILAEMRMQIWQVLPLNPLGYGNSPYQAYSSFAGDELYISLQKLCDDGLLEPPTLSGCAVPASAKVDYVLVRQAKQVLLQQAFAAFGPQLAIYADYQQFIANSHWVYNYAVFLSLKKAHRLEVWTAWPIEHKQWIKAPVPLPEFQAAIDYEIFLQFIFYRQWHQLKAYANAKGISIMGDIPIYIGMDSVDVWENQPLFLLDDEQQPTFIAGVPPDFFSETGQRWGNPLYDWPALQSSDFAFWIKRLRVNAAVFDLIRIDHFRAFDTYWKIPSSCPTAIEGVWVEAPGYALFDKIYQELPDIQIVAEDLGDLRKEVLQLRDHYQLKGMKVFQFIFDPLGNNYELEQVTNTIIYSGTHDNNTLIGWYQSLEQAQQQAINHYFKTNVGGIKAAILNYILNCAAEVVIFPLQDLIGLPETARFNTPGSVGSPNWEWKLTDFKLLLAEVDFIKQWLSSAQRI